MFAIIGAVIVFACVIGGYVLEHGNLSLLYQPVELLIIAGAACGAFVIGNPLRVIKGSIAGLIRILTNKSYTKNDYMEILLLLSEIFTKIRKEGLVSIESDVDSPEESKIFSKYPKFLKNHHAVTLVADTLRTVMTTSIAPHELESLLDAELEALHEEEMAPSKAITNIADAFPALGIVAAVLGVILTMAKMKEPPEVLGQSIGAALVGTFLGVLLSYGIVGPLGRSLEFIVAEDKEFLNVLKVGIVAFVGGAAPQIAVEFARRVVPTGVKPTFLEVEEAIRSLRK
ncbi:MAG: flagellar motor stator protein MotA [Nitrospiraceae bacterium]|jgi:chemotaxis protein MotA|nr:flagellar motor stator protein MotA [Nitrospiraceae bacterium]